MSAKGNRRLGPIEMLLYKNILADNILLFHLLTLIGVSGSKIQKFNMKKEEKI